MAALLLSLVGLAWHVWSQPKASPPPPAPAAASSAAPSHAANQDGLPVELKIDPKRLAEEEKALQAAQAYVQATKPAGNILSRAGRAISGFFSGKKRPASSSVRAVVESGSGANGKLVAVEGLYEVTKKGGEFLVEGPDKIQVDQLPQTIVQGFPNNDPNGLPARIEGTVFLRQQGPVITADQISPALSLTPIRLGRCAELRGDPGQAVPLYETAFKTDRASPWVGFATAHGGAIAENVVRDRKKAISLYTYAWELGSRAKGRAPADLPVTWVQDPQTGAWQSQGLRDSVGEPLDRLNRQGFWYKFVDTFVVICGGNAGLGLVLIAIVTRLLLYPLTRKQIQSAREMQRLQPEIKALQAKHGGDKQKFNEEFWRLCRDNKVNPLGGCLPLLIQMPLLIMVYRGIRAYVVQLSHHGFLWIHSLGDPDLPLLVLYTVSMIAFQKLTMKTQPVADPQQQQQQNMMVWMMPIMFFMFFQSMASGFILYWLATNLIYLPQQYFGTRLKTKEGEQDGGKERVVTLEPRSSGGSANPGEPAPQSLAARLKGLLGGKPPAPDEGTAPQSYEDKKLAEKRRQRRPTRRRRRRP